MPLPRIVASLVAVLLSIVLSGPVTAQTAPDLVLTNARVFTADPDRPWAEAVAIRAERISAVGSAAEIEALADDGTEVIDLEGRVVVPGLNDAHLHVGAWPEGVWLELGDGGPLPDPAWDEVVVAVETAVSEAEPDTWIFATIGVKSLEDPRADRFALDRIAPEHPVYLQANTGHGLILNTAALERLGIPLDAPNRPGGWYDREGGREIDGVLWEYADVEANRRLSMAEGRTKQVEAYRRLAERVLRWGITSFQHMSNSAPAEEVAAALAEADVPIRWTIYRWPMPQTDVAEAWPFEPAPLPEGSWVRHGGVKWMLDGTPVERGALMRRPYADRPGWHGRSNFTEVELRTILEAALRENEQPAFHVAGDSTLALVLETMRELASPEEWRELRVRIEHGDGLMSDLFPLAQAMGVVVVQNPLHFADPSAIRPRLGERADLYQPLRSLIEAGIPVALGADASGDAMNPWLNVMFAALHPSNPGEAVSVEEGVVAYTRGSAYAEKLEDEKGMLREGMLADLAVLSQDVFSVPLESLPATESVLTIAGGKVVYDDLSTAEPGSTGSPYPDPGAATTPQTGPTIEYLANEGVLVTGGDIAVVIDGLFGDGLPEYPVVPRAIRDSLEGALGRFRKIDVVLVTHRHDDHFDPSAVARHLEANPEAVLVAPGDVVAAFAPDQLERYGERVRPLDLPPGSYVRLDMGGFAVEALGLAHAQVGHVGYRIELPGLTVLHLGDAEPAPADLAAFLEGRPGPEVALVPYWVLSGSGGAAILEAIGADCTTAFHLEREGGDIVARLAEKAPSAAVLDEPGERLRAEDCR